MNHSELDIIKKWQSDPSFMNWINKSNEADTSKWNAYFNANPQHIEMAEIAKFSIQNIHPSPIVKDVAKGSAALSALHEKIAISNNQKITSSYSKFWKFAAFLLLIIALSIYGYTVFNSKGDQIIWANQEEQQELELADGTKVILNAYSTLSYFEKEIRNVNLTGEAYFEVTKKPSTNAPFQVKTEDLLVTVLGTKFNVNSENGQTSVYLDEGKVRLSLGEKSEQEIEIKPGELVSYSKQQDKILENRKANSLEKTAWKEKVLLFDETSISKVLETVSLVYGVTFETNLPDKKDQLFTGGLPVNDLNITLQTLKEIYQLDIKKVDEKYLIK